MNQKRPVSAARAATARANGAKSRSPITAAGKYNSSLNAVGHAIFAKCLVIPGESQAAFQQLFAEFHDALRPRTPIERAQSGIGRELGEYGLQQYTEVKTVTVKL